MMLLGFLLLLLLTGGSSGQSSGSLEEDVSSPDSGGSSGQSSGSLAEDVPSPDSGNLSCTCNEADIINHLNLTDKVKYVMTRPTKNVKETTEVLIVTHLHRILEVKEKKQELITDIQIDFGWNNPLISWDPEKFCGKEYIAVPADLLWKPDFSIAEMKEKNKVIRSEFLTIYSHGLVVSEIGMMLVSTCRMQFYKFPLDTQSCNLTFMSSAYSASDLNLTIYHDKSKETIHPEDDWKVINVTQKETAFYKYEHKSIIIFTVFFKRSSMLYVVNFILPILFFLCLDLSSFLISETGGEKLSFKVTVLLAVTVMQLILNDFLPSSPHRIPLIVIYCLGVFGLMLMSLLETILVMYLMEKDASSQNREADNKQSLSDDCRDKQGRYLNCLKAMNQLVHGSCFLDVPPGEMPSTPLQEGSSSQLTRESQEKLEDQLRDLVDLLHSNMKDEVKPGYWARKTKMINKIYLVFYITSATVFLAIVFPLWFHD